MLCCAKALELCLTPFDPMGCSPPGSSVRGTLQASILEWVAVPSSRGIFPTEVSKLSPLHLLYCRHILYPLSYLGRSPSLKVVDSNPTEQLIKYYHNIFFVKAERIYHFFWVISQKINSKISLYIFSLNIILKKRKFMNLTPPISEACSKNLSILT